MDKKIEKKKWPLSRVATYAGASLVLIIILYQFMFAERRSKLKVDRNKISISTVTKGIFQENIPETGTVSPSETFYLDAIEGGAIKKVYAESGSYLKKGDLIVELTNLNRELSVLSQEASLNESINRVRETRLSLEQNNLSHQQNLALIENELEKLAPRFEREKELYANEYISEQEFEATKADFKYYKKRQEITYTSYRKDSMNMKSQIRQLNESEIRMIKSLQRVGQILDNLVIRSPMDGQLATPQLFEGQSIAAGERLGQIDGVGSVKVRVPIDEIYMARIHQGLGANTKYAGKNYRLIITYIYPTVSNGVFTVDMEFEGDAPKDIKRGLSLRMNIELGESSEALLIPLGGFYNDTGGQWVYVLNADGSQAEKRRVKIGRKNKMNYELMEGLAPGEQIITSSYKNFNNTEILLLK